VTVTQIVDVCWNPILLGTKKAYVIELFPMRYARGERLRNAHIHVEIQIDYSVSLSLLSLYYSIVAGTCTGFSMVALSVLWMHFVLFV